MEAFAWGLPVLLLLLICPLMMVGMGVAAWFGIRLFGRSAGHNGHSSHAMCGPMMMMGHAQTGAPRRGPVGARQGGGHGDTGHEPEPQHSETSDLVAELKAQRERLDQLIARAEQESVQQETRESAG
jgi:hypothetical protein